MPTMATVFEREIFDLSRAALQLERLTACSEPIPGPVLYQQILNQLSELYRRWQQHRVHQRTRVSRCLPNDAEASIIVQHWDAPSFNVELQLKAVSISSWPRSVQVGLTSIRIAIPEILQLLYQQIARERATVATLIQPRRTELAKRPMLLRTEPVLKIKRVSA
ncbi:MAG TPA: hypothetical protein VFO86_04665 [Terriglobia bacterium]|nr:hypothetical protein [Terriglobia bacterium]